MLYCPHCNLIYTDNARSCAVCKETEVFLPPVLRTVQQQQHCKHFPSCPPGSDCEHEQQEHIRP
jgi:hypothetical protein